MKERESDRYNLPLPNGQNSSKPALPGETGMQEEDAPDLIELTDVVEPIDLERKGPDADLSPDEDLFIDLTEPIDLNALDARPSVSPQRDAIAQEETILDLFHMVDEPHADSSHKLSDPVEADLIELVDLAPPTATSDEEEPEGILRLDDILNSERDAAAPLFDLCDLSDPTPPVTDETPLTLTPAAIETAIDRIIQTRYGQTIEQMIATIVEKVVLREMQTLKRSLMDDEDDLTG
jgi:hypothetical protein